MPRGGVHHLGLATHDYDGTVEFYTNVLGWEIAWQDHHTSPDGEELLKHVFFDTGDGNLVAFMCSSPGSPYFPLEWETDINTGLGMKVPGTYHFAFWADSEEDLLERQDRIRNLGTEVSAIMNHGWCKGFYFRDPVNGLMLEYCFTTRAFTDDDRQLKGRAQPGFEGIRNQDDVEATARVLGVPPDAIPTA